MNTIERAKAKLERLQAIENSFNATCIDIVKAIDIANDTMTTTMETAEKADKALYKQYIAKLNRIRKQLVGGNE